MITPEDVAKTYAVIQPYVRRTPCLELALSDLVEVGAATGSPSASGPSVVLKLEHLQCAGSFKARGAFANLLLRAVPQAGVSAASGGNHGVAVAYAAQRLGIAAKIFVPSVSAPAKMERIRGLGAELVVVGERYADALEAAQAWSASSGALDVHAFDQVETQLGQGSVGLELGEQVPDVDTVLVPVGGGGLIAGIAARFAGSVQVVGVEPVDAPTLSRARAAGAPVDAPTGSVAADALAPRRIGELVFPLTQRYVSDVVLVDDDAILRARRALWQAARVLAEPAGSVGVAALLTGAYRPAAAERVAVVISGSNAAAGDVAG